MRRPTSCASGSRTSSPSSSARSRRPVGRARRCGAVQEDVDEFLTHGGPATSTRTGPRRCGRTGCRSRPCSTCGCRPAARPERVRTRGRRRRVLLLGGRHDLLSQRFAADLWDGVLGRLSGEGRAAGDFGVAYAVAHEYAHNLQAQFGVFDEFRGATVRPLELQADCFAGAWGNSVYKQGLLAAGGHRGGDRHRPRRRRLRHQQRATSRHPRRAPRRVAARLRERSALAVRPQC